MTDLIPPQEARTLDGLFRARTRRTPERPAYREFDPATGRWESVTWGQAAAETARWQAGLAAEGLSPGDRVAIMVPGGRAWVHFEQAALGLGLVVVPLFARDRPGSTAFVLESAGARLVLMTEAAEWQALLAEDHDLSAVSRVLTLKPAPQGAEGRVRAARDWLPAAGGELEGTEDGAALATLVYTSGTSGPPKGVMLSHRNILSNAAAALERVPVFATDVFLSFLPLNHMLERTAGYYAPMMAGAEVAFVREIPKIAEDLKIVRPTCIVSVPRIYERVHEKIVETLAEKPAAVRGLAALSARIGWHAFERAQGRAAWGPDLLLHPFLDRLVGAGVRQAFGGRLRSAISGGAALPRAASRFLIGQGLPILQGYGLTETSPVITVNTAEDNDPDSVGAPLPGVEVKIAAGGEILTRGPHIMLGYWRDEEATRKTIDEDGWLHTGDTGRLAGGKLYISGRLKDIIVLDTGEKISPTDMEHAIAADPAIDQVLIVGEGRSHLIAIVVPAARGPTDEEALLARIEARCTDFPGYARIRRVIVADEPWTLENGLMTATLKLKRPKILELYAERIEAVYAED